MIKVGIGLKFTFHYVSIKSGEGEDKKVTQVVFTFHYVSIKSSV